MGRHGGYSGRRNRGQHHHGRSGGNTRRLRTKKNTYAAKQSQPSEYWLPFQRGTTAPVMEREPRHRFPMPLQLGRKNKPSPKIKKQKPKENGRGGRGGKGGGGK